MTPISLGIFASANTTTTSYESIATVTVGSGGSSEVNFTSIPGTYTHLQVRIIARTASAATSDGLLMRVGTSGSIDTTSTLWGHFLMGDGSTATAGSRSSTNIEIVQTTAASSTSGIFGVAVIMQTQTKQRHFAH